MRQSEPLPKALEPTATKIAKVQRDMQAAAGDVTEITFNGVLDVWLALQRNPPLYFLTHNGRMNARNEAASTAFSRYLSDRFVIQTAERLGFAFDTDSDGINRAMRPDRMTPGWTGDRLAGPDDEFARYDVRHVLNGLGLYPSMSAEIVEYPMLMRHACKHMSPPEGAAPRFIREAVHALGGTIEKGGRIMRDWD